MATLDELSDLPDDAFGPAAPPRATDAQINFLLSLLRKAGWDEGDAIEHVADHFEEGFSGATEIGDLSIGEASWLIDEVR